MARRSVGQIQNDVEKLGLEDLRDLHAWITELMMERIDAEVNWQPPTDENTVEVQKVGTSCYQLQLVKCGKPGCKCEGGKLHGPYWYVYQRKDGRLTKKYIGKQRPSA
jgi:hypothetical protein